MDFEGAVQQLRDSLIVLSAVQERQTQGRLFNPTS
jgi:hypothetical protein